MRIEQIINNGLANFEQELASHVESCLSFTIAAAFIDKAGIGWLNRLLDKKAKVRRQGRMLTGLLNRFNTQADLYALQRLALQYPGRFQAAISRTYHFHWKYYAFQYKDRVVTYIGSANFTTGGLNRPGEWMVKMTASRSPDHRSILQWENTFLLEWEQAIPVSEFKVNLYKEVAAAGSGRPWEGLHPEIKQQLKVLQRSAGKEPGYQQVRFIWMQGYITKRAEKQIEIYQTAWTRKNWLYFNCGNKAEFRAAQKATDFVVVWREAHQYTFYWMQKLGECEITGPTDEKYFIAYKIVKGPIMETPAIRAGLEKIQLHYHSSDFTNKMMGSWQVQQLRTLMGWS